MGRETPRWSTRRGAAENGHGEGRRENGGRKGGPSDQQGGVSGEVDATGWMSWRSGLGNSGQCAAWKGGGGQDCPPHKGVSFRREGKAWSGGGCGGMWSLATGGPRAPKNSTPQTRW